MRAMERRRGARVVGGVPLPRPDETDAILYLAGLASWLADNRHLLRGTLLDLGCGGRPYAQWYEPLVAQVCAIDAAPNARASIRALADGLPLADETCDSVLATELLEHVEDPAAVCREIARVLKPGGCALITVPFVYPLHEAPFDFQRFTHLGLRNILASTGLQVQRIDARGGPVMLAIQLGILAVSRGLGGITGRVAGSRARTPISPLLARAQDVWVRHGGLGRLRRSVEGSAAIMSLGYMAVATKPR